MNIIDPKESPYVRELREALDEYQLKLRAGISHGQAILRLETAMRNGPDKELPGVRDYKVKASGE